MPDAERGVCRTPVVPVSLISQSFCLSLNSCQLRALRLPPCIIRFSPIDHLPIPSVYFFSPSTNTYPPQSLLSLVSPSAYRHSYSARIRSAPVASYRLFRPVSHPTYPSDQKLIRPQALFVRKRHQSTNACTWTPIHFIIAFHVPLLLSYSTTPVLNTRTGKSSKYTF